MRSTLRSGSCFQAKFWRLYFTACAFKSSSETNSSADECVASRSTGAARFASSADFQRVTQTHHLSPGFNPGNPQSGTGVIRSLPSSTEKSRNSCVTFTQTVCRPTSSGPVRQKPSRKNPVIGSRQQHFNSVPNTFVGIAQSTPGSSVETVDSPLLCRSACSIARQGSIAHFTRCGNLRTPRMT